MPTSEMTPATRLCTACGMCCNGVLFQVVRLQPGDSVKELEALGMKVSRRKREPYFKQPCALLNGCVCSQYAARPQRCRLFNCRQIQQVESGKVTEREAMRAIELAISRVKALEKLLAAAGGVPNGLALTERCEEVLKEESASEYHGALSAEMASLNELLNREFRTLRQGPPAL